MIKPEADNRTPAQKAEDQRIADEPRLPPLDLPANAETSAVESHLEKTAPRPRAIAGIVEHGLIRLLDTDIQLPEHSRVIVVTAQR